MGFFDRLKKGLNKTRENLTNKIEKIIIGYADIDEDLLDELEETLIMADVGVKTTDKLMTAVRKGIKKKEINTPEDLKPFLQHEIVKILTAGEDTTRIAEQGPTVLLVIGVNGAGKTTTIGKLAAYYKGQGKSVLLAAADTFRAAAIDQLEVWGQRTGVPVIKHEEGSDPAAVAFDAVKAAVARKVDMLIIDRTLHEGRADHGRRPDEARRHGQGRRRHRHQEPALHAGQVDRRRRGRRRPAPVQRRGFCQGALRELSTTKYHRDKKRGHMLCM